MPPPCDIETCKRRSRALCYCCNKNLCPDHLKEHDDSSNSQMHPIVDELNAVADRLSAINLDNVISHCRQKLDKWRDDSHMTIDRFYDEKCQELQQRCQERVDQKRKEIDQMKSEANVLIREQEATYEDIPLLKATVNDIKRDVNQFEEKGVHVATSPLTINKDRIHIEAWSMNQVDISSLSPPFRTIDCFDYDWPVMASNSQFLLFDQYPNLYLFDKELTIIKQTPWEYGRIPDICWSSTLNNFIIITQEDGVFLVNESMTSIESLQTIEKRKWLSCTCSNAALFLTTSENSSEIFQFKLLSSFELIKQWCSPESCDSGDFIHNISYSNGTLALLIQHKPENKLR